MSSGQETGRGRRRARWALIAAVVLGGLWVGLHTAANTQGILAGLRAKLEQRLGARLARYRLGPEVGVSWWGEFTFGPLTLDPDRATPPLTIGRVAVRPALGALLRGRAEPGRVHLEGVQVHTDARGKQLTDLLVPKAERTAASDSAASSGAMPTLVADDVEIEVEGRTLGPLSLRVDGHRLADGLEGEARVRFPGQGGQIRAEGKFSRASGWSASVSGQQVSVARALGPFAPAFVSIRAGTVSCDATVKAAPDFSRAEAQALVDVEGLLVAGERLAIAPVGPMRIGFVGAVDLEREHARLVLRDAHLLVGPESLPMPLSGDLELLPKPKFDAAFRVGPLPLKKLLAALPAQVVPGPETPYVDGPLSVEVRVAGAPAHPDQWEMALKLDLAGIKERARDAPFALRNAFSYSPDATEAGVRTIWVGTANPNFVPLSQLPSIVAHAVTTSEDAAFYIHQGFDLEGIQNGIASAVGGGKLRGGSTLTQQLVKNLYLTKDRTWARKISEALVTLQVEAALPKGRILEIYLNIIEWGPGVYGIGEAARYYFGVDARSLDPKQAVFLASIIPSPTHWGPAFRKNGLNDAWRKRLASLLETLHERAALSDDAYQQALDEPLRFKPF